MSGRSRRLAFGLLTTVLAACSGPPGSALPPQGPPESPPVPSSPSTRTAQPAPTASEPPAPVEELRFEVRAAHPHDPRAFTQGLEWHDGALWESTGQYGTSELRRVDPATGEVLERAVVGPSYFAEGLTRVGERWIQITWQEGTAFVWELPGPTEVARFSYDGEGWGLCFDGRRLVMSDGSAELTFRDPQTFEETGRVRVLQGDTPVRNLNELECADGAVYANVWGTEEIVRIDPDSGRVTARIRADGLLTRDERRGTDVMNGIAYRPDTETWLLTGKWWPKVFEGVFVAR